MSNVAQFKLISGEWVIGSVKEQLQETNSVVVEHALVIHVVPKGPDSYGIALIPFDPTNPEGTVEIYKSAIAARPASISKGLHDAYIQRTSAIEIVSSLEGVGA
jgi:hypothetical protein